jgi:peptidoglycan/LPS O-acetylase OafA/YrhL
MEIGWRLFALKNEKFSSTSRLEYLDALRGLAIVGVFFAHTASITSTQSLIGDFAALGSYGVQLFFVISAFTMFLTFERALVHERRPIKNFYIRRLLRIIPIYWMGIVLYTAVYGLGSRGWLPGPEIWHFPMNIFLVNLLHPETSGSVVPGGWSISCEVIFYLFVPTLFRYIKNSRAALIFVVTSCVLAPLFTNGLHSVLGPWSSQFGDEMESLFYYRNIVNQMPCFAFGILLYFILKEPPGPLFRLRLPGASIMALLLAGLLFAIAVEVKVPFGGNHIVFSAAFVVLALVLSQRPWTVFVNPFLRLMGKISFSTYILHFLVLAQITTFFPRGPQNNEITCFFTVLTTGLIVTIPLAYLSFKYIETNFSKLAKSLIVASEAKSRY